ncbi:MAG: response regulator [Pseudomonadota bacterium]
MRVFLVEDSPVLLGRLQAMIASIPGAQLMGHADTAPAAVQAIRAAPPDVVVLDLRLAQGSGFDVLRAIANLPGLAVYVLSNFSGTADRRAAARLGAAAFFDKTTEFEAFAAALRARAASATDHP